MSIDLDLIHDYMNSEVVPPSELLSARSILDEAIRFEIGWGIQGEGRSHATRERNRRSRRRAEWSVGVVAAVAASAVLFFQVLPSSKVGTSIAAAAQISRLAVTVQPRPPLEAGQWSNYQLQGVLSASVVQVANTPTPDAQSSIPITVEVWSNSTGTACTSQQFGSAVFASPANAQAWHDIGLIDAPKNQPVTDCTAGLESSAGAGPTMPAIDVSNLTQDPATLATQLQAGDTGIPVIDRTANGEPAHVAGFVRLTALLVGPTVGGWSRFGQEMLRTMALLPEVISIGKATSHSGKSGLAFSTNQQVTEDPQSGAVTARWSGPTLVLDAQTGVLLEARNFAIPVLQTAAEDFVGNLSAPVVANGGGYSISTQWIDPVTSPRIIGQDSLPGWISTFHIIEAVTKPTTTQEQVSTVLNPFLGNGVSTFMINGVPGAGQITFDITVKGTSANEEAVLTALTASGLFDGVTVKE